MTQEMISNEVQCGTTTEPFCTLAREYCLAAEILWKREKDERLPLVAPASSCLAQGLELFLKALLLDRGATVRELQSEYGHDVFKMWRLPEFEPMRKHAQGFALACKGVKLEPYADPEVYTLDNTVESLGRLHTRSSNFALRYPSGKNSVPYPQPLL